jgi:cytoskeletal protein CcmA (bactofilin family)
MFRPGRKDQAGGEHPSEQPTTSGFGAQNAADAQSRPTNTTATDQSSSTGARNMSETQPTNSRAVSESESLARDIKEGTLSGFVGNGTTLTGEANFKGMLRVDGHLSGRVSSQDGTLIVSTGGQVDADVEVSVAQIYGTVIGNITATKRIELGRVAKVTGDIQTPALVIEQGAMFEGSCRMQQIKEAQAKEEARPAASSSAATSSASLSSSATSSTSGAKPDGTSSGTSTTGTSSGASTTGTGASGSQSGAPKTTPATT